MAITAAQVKELRERTGAGMMECKKALVETDGDMETAIENMRKSGAAKAAKKSGRIAAEGIVSIASDANTVVLAETNSETDFVAKEPRFRALSQAVADAALAGNPADVAELSAMSIDGGTIEEVRQSLISEIGENMAVRRFERIDATGANVGHYQHGDKIAVVVVYSGGDEALGKDLAMHIAASRPVCVSPDDVPSDLVEKEREIYRAQALESGKPENIVDKIIGGQVNKFLNESALTGQKFVKNPDQTVAQLLKESGAEVTRFVRMEVGEGIEKKVENFADEVAAQAAAAKGE